MQGPIAATRSAGSGAELAHQRIDGDRRARAPPVRASRRARQRLHHFRIGNEERHAVGGLNRQRDGGIVGDDNVGFLARAGWTLPRPANHNRRAVDLVKTNEMSQTDAERRRDGRPLLVGAGSGTKRPCARRKEVIGQRPQRTADQGRPACRLHPLEAVARLWSHHYSQTSSASDSTPPTSTASRTQSSATASVFCADLHRRRDSVRDAPPCARHSFRRAVCRQGSDDEGARHRPLARACSGATSKSCAVAVRRNCSCTAGPRGGLPRWEAARRCSPSRIPTNSPSRRFSFSATKSVSRCTSRGIFPACANAPLQRATARPRSASGAKAAREGGNRGVNSRHASTRAGPRTRAPNSCALPFTVTL